MIGRVAITSGSDGWPRAQPLLQAVWPPEVVATLPWKDVVWAHASRRVLVFNEAGDIIGHVGVFLRDVTWDARPVKIGGIGSVATREDYRRQGVASAAMRAAARYMCDDHSVDFGLLFCEVRHAPVYEQLGWRRFDGEVFAMQPGGRVRFNVTRAYVLDMNLAPRHGMLDLCGLPW
jgi:aminoglycoside 2'-N-acetyltransferase I